MLVRQVQKEINKLCRNSGRVSDHDGNVGGLDINSYADGDTPYVAVSMDKDGAFTFRKNISAPNIHSITFYSATVTNDSINDNGNIIYQIQ